VRRILAVLDAARRETPPQDQASAGRSAADPATTPEPPARDLATTAEVKTRAVPPVQDRVNPLDAKTPTEAQAGNKPHAQDRTAPPQPQTQGHTASSVVAFGDSAPRASPGVALLRSADLAGTGSAADRPPPRRCAGYRASCTYSGGDYLPASVQTVLLPADGTGLRVQFAAPTPLGLLKPLTTRP